MSEPVGLHAADTFRFGFGASDAVAGMLDRMATDTKAGTEHEGHDGWSWPYPNRDLICGCGAVLVEHKGSER